MQNFIPLAIPRQGGKEKDRTALIGRSAVHCAKADCMKHRHAEKILCYFPLFFFLFYIQPADGVLTHSMNLFPMAAMEIISHFTAKLHHKGFKYAAGGVLLILNHISLKILIRSITIPIKLESLPTAGKVPCLC